MKSFKELNEVVKKESGNSDEIRSVEDEEIDKGIQAIILKLDKALAKNIGESGNHRFVHVTLQGVIVDYTLKTKVPRGFRLDRQELESILKIAGTKFRWLEGNTAQKGLSIALTHK